MKNLKQFAIVLLFSIVSEAMAVLIPLPIPAAIYGIILMLIALGTGIVKLDMVSGATKFLIAIMPLLFIAPAVNILKSWDLIAPHLVPICIITVVSTAVVFAVSGLVTKLLLGKGDAENG